MQTSDVKIFFESERLTIHAHRILKKDTVYFY